MAETDDEHPPHDVAWLLEGIPEEQRAKALQRLEEEDTVPRYKRTVEGQLTPEQRAMSERARQHADGLAPSPMLRVKSFTVCDPARLVEEFDNVNAQIDALERGAPTLVDRSDEGLGVVDNSAALLERLRARRDVLEAAITAAADKAATSTAELEAEYQRLRVKLGLVDEAELDPVALALIEAGMAVDEALAEGQDGRQEKHLERKRKEQLGLEEDDDASRPPKHVETMHGVVAIVKHEKPTPWIEIVNLQGPGAPGPRFTREEVEPLIEALIEWVDEVDGGDHIMALLGHRLTDREGGQP